MVCAYPSIDDNPLKVMTIHNSAFPKWNEKWAELVLSRHQSTCFELLLRVPLAGQGSGSGVWGIPKPSLRVIGVRSSKECKCGLPASVIFINLVLSMKSSRSLRHASRWKMTDDGENQRNYNLRLSPLSWTSSYGCLWNMYVIVAAIFQSNHAANQKQQRLHCFPLSRSYAFRNNSQVHVGQRYLRRLQRFSQGSRDARALCNQGFTGKDLDSKELR